MKAISDILEQASVFAFRALPRKSLLWGCFTPFDAVCIGGGGSGSKDKMKTHLQSLQSLGEGIDPAGPDPSAS